MTASETAKLISGIPGDNILIAIDGRSASGKTTLADKISEHIDCNIIHCDDFFLPPEMRTRERLLEPGGNTHYERLKKEVIDAEDIRYGVFSCKEMKIERYVTPPKKRVTILEGAYSMHPALTAKYDLSIFVNVSPDVQKKRILKRNGEKSLNDFVTRWIPMEERYISYYNIEEKCDIFLDFSMGI